MNELPEPMVPADVDLTGFPSFGLNVERLLASELVALCSPAEGWAAVMLWSRAWQQHPPGSLPNDERVLAAFSKAKNWKQVRTMALRGFVLCSDGRLYHPMLAEEAMRCWASRLKHQEDKAKNAEKLRSWRERQREKNQLRTGDVTSYEDVSETGSVTSYETGKRGKGIGEGEGEGFKTSTTTDVVVADSQQAADLFLAHSTEKPEKPDCPHKEIIALYHEILPMCPKIREWTPSRAQLLRARWSENKDRQNLDYWRRFFTYVAESDFLTGRTSSPGRKPFHASLEWMCKAENFTKIREERYHEGAAA
jgi:Protein of unknown function (DUF1376)